MRYQAIDSNDNQVVTDREITVIDTIAPQVALVTHDYYSGTPLVTVNTEDFDDKPVVDTKYPIPESITSFLQPISQQFTEEKFSDNIFAVTLLIMKTSIFHWSQIQPRSRHSWENPQPPTTKTQQLKK